MGISRDSMHKRRHTGARRVPIRSKRKFELGRQPANTKLGEKKVHEVRVRGGNKKFRALKLDSGNWNWPGEATTRKARILTVVYNATSNEMVRTNTLVKGAVVQIDSAPFKNWYAKYYGVHLGKQKKVGFLLV
jgi:small subunit ribosomal protein S8e